MARSLLWAAETPLELLLLMPFASGGDLHAALGSLGNRTLSEVAAARLCEQLLSGWKLRAFQRPCMPSECFL